jgi:hypothetical protein
MVGVLLFLKGVLKILKSLVRPDSYRGQLVPQADALRKWRFLGFFKPVL